MSPRKLLNLGLLCIFYLHTSRAVKVENILTKSDFVQILEPMGEYIFQFDGDELFHVDLQLKETKWRLPEFGQVASFDAAEAFPDMSVLKFNLDIYEKRSNFTKAKNVARDDIHIYTKNPLVLGEPLTLVCLATQFFPPVIKMSWLKNNEPVTVGVTDSVYYPAPDGTFSKFLYLATIPQKDDVYTCSVEHDGLSKNPTNKFWYPEVPSHISHSSNVVCGLGLAFGIFGIVVGIVLIFKGRKNMNQARGH